MLLNEIKLEREAARKELATLKKWLDKHEWFSEAEVVKKLRGAKTLCGYLGKLNPKAIPTHMRFEVSILGAFRADLVIGDLERQRYVFVEFEGGRKNSIHSSRGTHQMRDWGKEFSKGWSQLIDWSWAMKDRHDILASNLGSGKKRPNAVYCLVCGRKSSFTGPTAETDENRYDWLENNAVIGGAQIVCMTYDGMIDYLAAQVGP